MPTYKEKVAQKGGKTSDILRQYVNGSKDVVNALVKSGLLAQGGGRMGRYADGLQDSAVQAALSKADADEALGSSLLSAAGLADKAAVDKFLGKTITPASGTTPASRAAARAAGDLTLGYKDPVGAKMATNVSTGNTDIKVSPDQVAALEAAGEPISDEVRRTLAGEKVDGYSLADVPVAPAGAAEDAQTTQATQPGVQPAQQDPQAATQTLANQAGDATITGQQVGGQLMTPQGTRNFGRVGTDVYELMTDGTRRKVTEAEFIGTLRQQGLNLDVLPQLDTEDGTRGVSGDIQETPKDFISRYRAAYKESGVADLKTKAEEMRDEFETLALEKTQKARDINNNPWLTEGVRVRQLQELDEEYEDREQILTSKMQLYDSLYQQGVAEAKFIATGQQQEAQFMLELAQNQFEAESQLGLETLSPGQTLYDPNSGEALYTAPGGKGSSDIFGGGDDLFGGGGISGNIPTSHNNPLAVTVGGATRKWIDNGLATAGRSNQDGTFLAFASVKDGWQAAKDLLLSPIYNSLKVPQAMAKWSNGGYGADIAPELNGKTIAQLTPAEADSLMQRMAAREGFQASANVPDTRVEKLPPVLQTYVRKTGDGVTYMDVSDFTGDTQIKAKAYAARVGIPAIILDEGDKKLMDSMDKVDGLLENLSKEYDEAAGTGTANNTIFGRFTGLWRRAASDLGIESPQQRAYNAIKDASISIIARAYSGETGTLNDRDVERARNALPALQDSYTDKGKKLENLTQGIRTNRATFYRRIGLPEPTGATTDDDILKQYGL